MANGNKHGKNNGSGTGNNNGNANGNPLEAAELTSEDYEIIAAGLVALGEVFSFLALLKAKQVTQESGGFVDVPELFTLSTKKTPKRKRR